MFQYGNVTCDSDEKDNGARLEIVVPEKNRGRWALRHPGRGYFLGAASDKLICTAKSPTENELWWVFFYLIFLLKKLKKKEKVWSWLVSLLRHQVRAFGGASANQFAFHRPSTIRSFERLRRRDSRGRQHSVGGVDALHARVSRRFAPLRHPHVQQSLSEPRRASAGEMQRSLSVRHRIFRRFVCPEGHPRTLLGSPRIQGIDPSAALSTGRGSPGPLPDECPNRLVCFFHFFAGHSEDAFHVRHQRRTVHAGRLSGPGRFRFRHERTPRIRQTRFFILFRTIFFFYTRLVCRTSCSGSKGRSPGPFRAEIIIFFFSRGSLKQRCHEGHPPRAYWSVSPPPSPSPPFSTPHAPPILLKRVVCHLFAVHGTQHKFRLKVGAGEKDAEGRGTGNECLASFCIINLTEKTFNSLMTRQPHDSRDAVWPFQFFFLQRSVTSPSACDVTGDADWDATNFSLKKIESRRPRRPYVAVSLSSGPLFW